MKPSKYYFLFFMFLSMQNIIAQEETVELWPAGKVPNSTGVVLQDKMENQRQSAVGTPCMYVYMPGRELFNGKAILICPGGGYGRESMYLEGHDIAKVFNTMGVAAFVLKYRLPQGANVVPEQSYKVPLQDAQRALKIIRSRAGEWKIDPDKIGITGFSAGGHLAASAGTLFKTNDWSNIGDATDRFSCRPDFMILFYPVISMDKSVTHGGSLTNLLGKNRNEELLNLFSCEKHVTGETPPAMFILADNDKAVPSENSLAFYQAMRKNNIPAALHIFTKGGHGFGLPAKGEATIWPQLVKEWLTVLDSK